MRHDDSVEFLVPGPDDGMDEELVQPEGFPRLRRARLPLFVAAAVALVALVVVTVVNGPSGTPSAAPQRTVTVSPSPTSSAPEPPPAGDGGVVFQPGPLIVLHVPPGRRIVRVPDVTCPSGASCDATFTTPRALATTIRRFLPKAGSLHTVTTTVHRDGPGSQLLTRRIVGRVGDARLTIDIRPAGRHDVLGWNAAENASQTLVTAARHVGGRLVSAQLVAPSGYQVSIYAVGHLVADPRLTRLA